MFQLPSDPRSYEANYMPSVSGSVSTELRGQSHHRPESPAPSPYYLGVPQPLESPPGLVWGGVAQQPEWRLRDQEEAGEESQVEEGGEQGHQPPVEAGSKRVAQRDAQSHHQTVEGEEGSSVLQLTKNILMELSQSHPRYLY